MKMNGKGGKGKAGDTSKIPQNQFTRRAMIGVLNNWDPKSYTITKKGKSKKGK